MKKIVSHLPPRHMDDFFAIALLKERYPEAEIELVHPQKVPEEYYKDPQVAIVDAGGQYNPLLKNFDHHQDPNIPCSLVLVMRDLGLEELAEAPAVKAIDLIDRIGFKAALDQKGNEWGIAPSSDVAKMMQVVLLADLNKYSKEIAQTFKKTANTGYNDFVQNLYRELDSLGVLDEPKRKIEEEERLFRERVSKAQIENIDNLKVVFSKESFAPMHSRVFSELGADVIVERNKMNPNQTSIIKNTASPNTSHLDLSRVFGEDAPKVFIHNTGFIAVIDRNIETITLDDVKEFIRRASTPAVRLENESSGPAPGR